jgi:hypothetical protein
MNTAIFPRGTISGAQPDVCQEPSASPLEDRCAPAFSDRPDAGEFGKAGSDTYGQPPVRKVKPGAATLVPSAAKIVDTQSLAEIASTAPVPSSFPSLFL